MNMNKNLIASIAIPSPLARLFDYVVPQAIDIKCLIPGVRIRVPFQHRELVGILIEVKNKSNLPYDKLKSILEILDSEPIFTPDIFKICQFASSYYHHPLGEVFASAMPSLLRKGRKNIKSDGGPTHANKPKTYSEKTDKPLSLNDAQQKALDAIIAAQGTFQTFLLDGVTGSGKTEIYLRAISNVLAVGKQILVLIPEISLTPQTIARFRARFAVPVVALHSSLSEKKRLEAYLCARSGEVKIIIGTRSAIFTPFANLGLIIVDEEHDSSFKQQERFRYHARDLAIMRARINNIPIVLGSATPSLESLYNVNAKRYIYLKLPTRAGDAQLPTYELLDLRSPTTQQGIANALLEKIKAHLDANNQVLLFLNKRGFAPVLYCTACTHIIHCNNCDSRLVFHHRPKRLQCHLCDFKTAVPEKCAHCNTTNLEPIGFGTQRLEETLQKHFPDTPIIRVDRDNTRRKGAMEGLIEQIHREPKAILIGTQMLAKGHHFPNITLVGIIDADSGFFSVDFRATEQIGQLLLQVAGRAGRANKPGTVVIQTRHPQNPPLQILLQQGYSSFAEYLLAERSQTKLPPYTYFAIIRAEARDELKTQQFLTMLKKMGTQLQSETKDNKGTDKEIIHNVEIFGPVPALIAKRKGNYCQHLIIKANRRQILQQFLQKIMKRIEEMPLVKHSGIPPGIKKMPRIKWILDVDPIEM